MKSFITNQEIFAVGINMNCKKVVSKSIFLRYMTDAEKIEHPKLDCIINVGFKMFSNSNDHFVTRKEVKNKILLG